MTPDETRRKRDAYPIIAELRNLLSVAVLRDEDDGTRTLGKPTSVGSLLRLGDWR
jgi:hypothetical protein